MLQRKITRLRLHAPANFEPGSSVSHWTVDSSPNLLMEPRINRDIAPNLDLTTLFMKDLGWNTQNNTIPFLTYDLWLIQTGLDQEAEQHREGRRLRRRRPFQSSRNTIHGTDPQNRQDSIPAQSQSSTDGTLEHPARRPRERPSHLRVSTGAKPSRTSPPLLADRNHHRSF